MSIEAIEGSSLAVSISNLLLYMNAEVSQRTKFTILFLLFHPWQTVINFRDLFEDWFTSLASI